MMMRLLRMRRRGSRMGVRRRTVLMVMEMMVTVMHSRAPVGCRSCLLKFRWESACLSRAKSRSHGEAVPSEESRH